MKRYDSYKDSGVAWIGEIPGHWEVVRFSQHFSFGKGLPITKADLIEDGIAVISYGQIHSKLNAATSMTKQLVRYVSSTYLDSHPQCLLNKGDFIFADTSEDIEGSGNFAFNDYADKIFAGYHTLVARPMDIPFPKYLAYLFKSKDWKSQIQGIVNGVKVYSISKGKLKGTTFILPPLSEQELIVCYLDNKLLKIDAYVGEKEREIVALEELRQSEIARIVCKGLNADVRMRDSGIAWIGEIPEHWEVVRLGNLFTENKTKNTDLEYTRALKFNYGSLVPKGESGDLSDLEDTYSGYTKIKKNDIAINGLNLNYDLVSQRVAIAKENGILTSAYLILSPREGVNADYFAYLFKGMDAKKLFHGMGTGIRLTLSYTELKKQALVVPPLSEQRAIVSHIEKRLCEIDLMVVSLRRQIECLSELRQRLISDAVTGRVRIE